MSAFYKSKTLKWVPGICNKNGICALEVTGAEIVYICPVCGEKLRCSRKAFGVLAMCKTCRECKRCEDKRKTQSLDDTPGNSVPTERELTERIFKNFQHRTGREIDEIALLKRC